MPGIKEFRCPRCGNNLFLIEFKLVLVNFPAEVRNDFNTKDTLNSEPRMFRCSACQTAYRGIDIDGTMTMMEVEKQQELQE